MWFLISKIVHVIGNVLWLGGGAVVAFAFVMLANEGAEVRLKSTQVLQKLTRFVVTPVSQVLNVLRRQSLHLISSGTDATLLLAAFAAAWWFSLAPMTTILLLSLGSTAAYLLYLVLAWGVVRSAGRTTTAPLAALPALSGR